MARLAGSLERAQAIGDRQHAKARDLHYDLENELEHGLYNEDEATEAEQAIGHLETRFPGVKAESRSIERPPNLSRRAKTELDREPGHEGRTRRASPGARPRRPAPSSRGQGRTPPRKTRSGSRAVQRAWTSTGIPQTSLSVSQLVMRALGGIAGLSLLGLLLSPRGSRAVTLTGAGVTHTLEALVNPAVDPFRAGAGAAAVRARAAPARAGPAPTIAQAPLHTQG